VGLKTPRASYDPSIRAWHGVHVVVKIPSWHGLSDCNRVRTFDFGRHGRGALPCWGEDGGKTERMAVFAGGQGFVLGERVAVAGGMAYDHWAAVTSSFR